MKTQGVLAAALLASSAILSPSLARASAAYALTDLSPYGKLVLSDINNAGDLAGQVLVTLAGPPEDPDPYVEYHGFVLSQGQFTVLPPFNTPGGQLRQSYPPGQRWDYFATSGAVALNQQGQTAGFSDDIGTDYGQWVTQGRQGYVYQNGQFTKLGLDFTPVGINQQGQIAGNTGVYFQHGALVDTRAARVYANGQFTDLGNLGVSSVAHGINDQGHVTGLSVLSHDLLNAVSVEHAFLHDGTHLIDLGTLGGTFSQGLAINNADQVTGSSTTASGALHPFFYSSGLLTDLGLLPGAIDGEGLDINAQGDVVGSFTFGPEGARYTHAFLFRGRQLLDLNTLLDPALASEWVLSTAVAINDEGLIIGQGMRNGVATAFLLSPVPEPQGWSLVASGMLALGAWRRRSRGQLARAAQRPASALS